MYIYPVCLAAQALCSTVISVITRIEIDGYKGFEDFSMDFSPFTVIAGVNGVGKSNLFDALRHISRLVSETLVEAFITDRGAYEELFTLFPSGKRRDNIGYAVEMLLPEKVEDQFSAEAQLQNLRLRYELSIRMETPRKFNLLHERLTYIKKVDDNFTAKHQEVRDYLPKLSRGRQTPFIDTEENQITISQDGNAGRKRVVSRDGAQRTVLSSITTIEFPHAYAARKMLENIHFLQLNPEKLRVSSKFSAPQSLSQDGENLAAVLARLIERDADVEQMVSNDLASIIPGVSEFFLRYDEMREEYVVGIKHIDGYEIPSKLLSDGTLRILALIAISYDPEFNGLIILEEPENGVHPRRIPQIVDLLQSMAGFPNSSDGYGYKQVVANTHSMVVVRCVTGSLALATTKRVPDRENGPHTVTEVVSADDEVLRLIFESQLEEMLNSEKGASSLQTVV